MNLHQKISYPDFLVLLIEYYKSTGLSDMFLIDYLYEYSKTVYENKQFVILDEGNFMTWAFISDEDEKLLMQGSDYIFNTEGLTKGNNLWIIDALIPPKRVSGFIKAWHKAFVPRFDRFKCVLLNNMEQHYREIRLVQVI